MRLECCKSNWESFLQKSGVKIRQTSQKSNTYVANTEIRSWSNTIRDRQRAGRHQGKNRSRLQIEIPKNPKMKLFREMQIPKNKAYLSQTPLQHQQILYMDSV